MSIEDAFAAAMDELYDRCGVDVVLPFAPDRTGPVTVRGIHEEFDPTRVPLGTEVSEWTVGESRAVYSFRRADVPELTRDLLLEAPETDGGPTITWKVESVTSKTAREVKVLCRVVR